MQDGTTRNRPPITDDVALDDKDVCAILNISKSTKLRWEDKYGLPKPSFYVGQRGFTWRSDLNRWIEDRPRENALAGKYQPHSQAHQAA